MTTVKFVRTSMLDSTRQSKSVAIVEVNGIEIEIDFWVELIEQWGKEGTKQFLCAEALLRTGNLADAHELLKPDATGKLVTDKDGLVIQDSRSWQQSWIDSYPIKIVEHILVDPLA
jgi:hypothetical protein